MVALPLTSGAYASESYIASAQRSINLYTEKNPQEIHAPFPTTHYVRPGLKLLGSPPQFGPGRMLYATTNGDLYAVVGQKVFYIDQNWNYNLLGALLADVSTPAYMSDNGANAFLVDGSAQGYTINLPTASVPTRTLTQVADPNFNGSDRVDFIDSYFIFNKRGTNEWYCSLSESTAFNALYVGVKTAWPDNVVCVVAIEREVWVFGPRKSEAWFNAGGTPFPFDILPGVIIEQGCAAKNSPAKMDTNVYWLSQSPEGARMVMRGNAQNVAQRISTHAIENEFLSYARVDDAIGSVYQIEGHSFYELHFPTADKTWTYDQATDQWMEDCSIDKNGVLHRARNTFTAYAYGMNLALDWQTGQLYQIDPQTYYDNGLDIPLIRSWPHFTNELKYVTLASVTADVETGTRAGTGNQAPTIPSVLPMPTVSLRLSRNGGATYGNYRPKAGVSSGRYRSMMRWRGNGLARDWVIEISSTAAMCGALNGVYIEPIAAGA